MTIAITGVHPYADKYPMLPESELIELAESIAANGLRSPVVVTPDGLIIDGRNRAAACEQAGVTPETAVYEGDDLAEYVIDVNTARRHMSTGARAMSTALVLVADGRRVGGAFERGSVTGNGSVSSGGWAQRVKEAGLVLDHAPELAERVRDGDLALDAAYRQACEARDAERLRLEDDERRAAEEADAKAFVEQRAPEMVAVVGEGRQFETFVIARFAWEQKNREEAKRLKAEREEKARREREDRAARSENYSTMARGLQILGSHGMHRDVDLVMREFDPAELHPPQFIREFSADNLTRVEDFARDLRTWMEARRAS